MNLMMIMVYQKLTLKWLTSTECKTLIESWKIVTKKTQKPPKYSLTSKLFQQTILRNTNQPLAQIILDKLLIMKDFKNSKLKDNKHFLQSFEVLQIKNKI
jgi:hypothetical protein